MRGPALSSKLHELRYSHRPHPVIRAGVGVLAGLPISSCVSSGRALVEVELSGGPWSVNPERLGDEELAFRIVNTGSEPHQPVIVRTDIPATELPIVDDTVNLAGIHLVWPSEGDSSEWPPDHGVDELFPLIAPGESTTEAPRKLGEGSAVGPLSFEEVTFPAPLGELGAWKIPSGDGSRWAIHAHGWRASRREALRTLPVYHQAGITSLVFDYRNDEGAPDDPSGLCRFGKTEWEDVEAAGRYALEQGAEQIVLHGYSTGAALHLAFGAALHLAFLEKSALASEVGAAVYDSPNADTGAALRLEASRRTIPGTSIPVPGSLIGVAMLLADLRWDVGWDEIDYIERSAEIISTPTLIFHGVRDDRVPIDVARRLPDGSPDLVRLIEIEEAGHVTSWNVDPKAYESRLLAFLEEIGK